MARKSYTARDHHHFVAAFAKREKLSLRTAQRLRQINDERWTRFVETLKRETPSPPAPPPDTENEIIPPESVTPENMHHAILGMWHSTNRAWWRATAEGDELAMIDLDSSLRQIQRGWISAVKSKELHDQFVKNHVPASEIAGLLKGFFEPLKTTLEAMSAEAGPMTNPGNHAAGRAGCMEWRESRLLPALERVFEKLADYAVAI